MNLSRLVTLCKGKYPQLSCHIRAFATLTSVPLLELEEQPIFGDIKLVPAFFSRPDKKPHDQSGASRPAEYDFVLFVIIVNDRDEILLVQEPMRKSYKWFLPAGHVEAGESLKVGMQSDL